MAPLDVCDTVNAWFGDQVERKNSCPASVTTPHSRPVSDPTVEQPLSALAQALNPNIPSCPDSGRFPEIFSSPSRGRFDLWRSRHDAADYRLMIHRFLTLNETPPGPCKRPGRSGTGVCPGTLKHLPDHIPESGSVRKLPKGPAVRVVVYCAKETSMGDRRNSGLLLPSELEVGL